MNLLAKMSLYIKRLYPCKYDDPEEEALKVKFEVDLKLAIESSGKKGKSYILHFWNDLAGRRNHSCPYCYRYFGTKQARLIHMKHHEKYYDYFDAQHIPVFGRKWHTCIVCGEKSAS